MTAYEHFVKAAEDRQRAPLYIKSTKEYHDDRVFSALVALAHDQEQRLAALEAAMAGRS